MFVFDIWRLLGAAQRRWVLIAQLASLLMASSTVVGIAAVSPFFAVLAEPRLIAQSPILMRLYGDCGFRSDRGFIVALGIGFAVMVVFTNLVNWAGSYAMQRVALRVGDDMRTLLFGTYLHRNVVYHAGIHSATLCNNVAYETERSIVTTLESTFVLVTSLVTTGLIVLSVLLINAPAAVAILSALLGGYCCVYLAVRKRIFRAGHLASMLAAARMKLILESFGAIKEVTVLRKQAFFQRRFEQSSRRLSRLTAYLDVLTQSPKYVMESIAVGGLVGIALVLSEPSGPGRWLAQLTFLAFAVYRLLPALQQAFASIVRIRTAGASFAVIAADLLQGRTERRECSAGLELPGEAPRRSIELSNVSFRYEGSSRPALDAVSLTIVPGTIVGFIGSNGSGKTTAADILAGLIVPDSGHVLVDGVPLDDTTRRAWQSRIAYVPQSTFLLDLTIAENIALGIEPGQIDQARLRSAAHLAKLDDVVNLLPGRYSQVIGERGVRLSGGQRQRLGIARALYSNAPILIMDEATSALDGSAEEDIMAAIERLRGVRTIILIAHRRNTWRRCDVIVELHQGKVTRSGARQEFIAKPALKAVPVET
jgi:ATP-binding cassette, subfamily B, bacterial PglK